jgi:hypothetical protein
MMVPQTDRKMDGVAFSLLSFIGVTSYKNERITNGRNDVSDSVVRGVVNCSEKGFRLLN